MSRTKTAPAAAPAPDTILRLLLTTEDGDREVVVDLSQDLAPLQPGEFFLMTNFIARLRAERNPQTDDEAQLVLLAGSVLVHLHRALPEMDVLSLSEAVRESL